MANNQIKIRIVENNTEEVKALLKERKKKIFHAWGLKWVERVTNLVPVDTGRLRQSMHFRTRTNHVAVGTNVEYAVFINNGTSGRRRPKKKKGEGTKKKKPPVRGKFPKKKLWDGKKALKFMEKSTIENRDEYKLIAEQILKE